MRFCVAFAAVVLAAPVAAQVRPTPTNSNLHLHTVPYDPEAIVELSAAPGYQLTVALSPDEQVQNVAVGDAAAWQVSVNHAGDHLFIKTSAPVATNMTVITTVRVYNFDLYPVGQLLPDTPYTIRFTYPDIPEADAGEQYVDVSPLRRAQSRYRISGERSLRPDSVTSDADRTYISWSREKAIPAVYAVGSGGEEVLANGTMRDDVYVVDGVPAELIFRVDNHSAKAVWLPPRKKH